MASSRTETSPQATTVTLPAARTPVAPLVLLDGTVVEEEGDVVDVPVVVVDALVVVAAAAALADLPPLEAVPGRMTGLPVATLAADEAAAAREDEMAGLLMSGRPLDVDEVAALDAAAAEEGDDDDEEEPARTGLMAGQVKSNRGV